MTQRFLAAAYSRRKAPNTYDPQWINVELARIAKTMTSYVIRNVVANTQLQINDGMLLVDCTTGPITVTLMAPALGSGQPVTIKKADASANAVTIGGTVDAVLNRTLTNQHDSIIIQSDGVTWFRPTLTLPTPLATTYSLTAGTHLSGGPFNGGAAVTLNTDGTEFNTASTLIARDASGFFAAGSASLLSLGINAGSAGTTNLLAYSQLFNSAPWAFVGASVSALVTDPLGGTTAQTLLQSASDGADFQPVYFTTDGSKSISVHLKYGNVATTEFGVYDGTVGGWACRFRATWAAGVPTITVVQGSGNTFGATSLGSGWYRCYGTIFSITAANANTFALYVTSAGGGTAGNYVYAWGAQAEDDAVTSAYSATTAQGVAITATGRVNITGATAIAGNTTITGTLAVSSTLTAAKTALGGASLSTTSFLVLPAGTTAASALRTAPGAAPTSRVTGDLWGTSAGLHYHAGTTTVGPLIDSGPVFLLMGA